MRKAFTLFLLALCAIAAVAQTPHSVALSCTASTSSGVNSYNFYKAPCTGTITAGACSAEGTFAKTGSSPTCSFTDSAVTALQKAAYYVTAVCPTCVPSESVPSNHIAVTIPADGQPNPPTGLSVTSIALDNTGATSIVAASFVNIPNTVTSYVLDGTSTDFQGRVHTTTIAKGASPSDTGAYTVKWQGARVTAVKLTICDFRGCTSQSN